MADKKISALTDGSSAQATDLYVIARGSNNFKITGANVAAAATSVGTLSSLTVSGGITANGQVVGGGSSGAQFLGTNVAYTGSRVFFATQGDSTQRINVGHYDSSTLSFPTGQVPSQILAGVSNLEIAPRDIAGSAIIFRAGSGVSEQMRLTSTGLGIGTTSPAQKLDVSGADGVRARVVATSGGTPGLILSSAGNTAYAIKAGNADNSLRIDQDGTDRVTLASGGNLGLGVTPSAWSTYKALQLPGGSLIGANNAVELWSNAFFDGTIKYVSTAAATRYNMANGVHAWYTAASGTAGTTASFTQAMTLSASGNLAVGTTNASAQLTVKAGASDGVGVRILRNASGVAAFQITDDPVTVANVALAYNHSTTTASLGTTGTLTFDAGSSERARITSGGLLLVGGKTSGTDTVEGPGFGINGNAAISVSTSATTIFTVSQTVTGAMCVVFGDNGSDGFMDLLFFLANQTPKVVSSQTMYGTPPARTYTASTTALRCAMASGTYTLRTAAFSPINT